VTAAAVGATAYAAWLGQQTADDSDPPVPPEDAAEAVTSDASDGVKRRLALLQWVVPALTGTLVVLNAKMGEQQRPQNVVQGVVERVREQASR